jgi:hypothetical protein
MQAFIAPILIILFTSMGGDQKENFLGVWGEENEYGHGPLVLISEKNNEIMVTTDWRDIGEGTFKAKIEGNNLSYIAKTVSGQVPIEMTYNNKTNKLSLSTLGNRIVELKNYNVHSLDDAIGKWVNPCQDSLKVTKGDKHYDIKWVWNSSPVQEDEFFIKDKVCYANVEGIGSIRYVMVKSDTILISEALGSIINFVRVE